MAAQVQNKHSNYLVKQIDKGVVRDGNAEVREGEKEL